MPNSVVWNHDLNIIEINFWESISSEDLEESTVTALKLAHDHKLSKFLVDISEADITAPLVDVYDLPDKRFDEMGADRKNRLALIPSSSAKGKKDAKFFENACVNRGRVVRIFTKYEAAIEWLLTNHQDV